MDSTTYILVAFSFLLAVIILFLARRAPRLPIVDSKATCEGCKFFSLEGGQSAMAAQPAFAAAAQVLPPWQMGQPRKVKTNPEYALLEARMQAAGAEGDHELEHALHEELLKIRPGELLPPEDYIEEGLLRAQWTDFGACGRHSELRLKSDCCPEREPKA